MSLISASDSNSVQYVSSAHMSARLSARSRNKVQKQHHEVYFILKQLIESVWKQTEKLVVISKRNSDDLT